MDTKERDAAAYPPIGAPEPTPATRRRRKVPRSRPRLLLDLAVLGVIGALLVAATGASYSVLYERFYSPTAFVVRYLNLLSEGQAAEALAVPGVALTEAELQAQDLSPDASDALLRKAALGQLSDITPVSETTDGDVTEVTVSYKAMGNPATTTFEVARDGVIGVAPAWRFTTSPLGIIDVTVLGSMQFSVNGFEIDKRQVSADGVDADPLAAIPMLVFSPGIYTVSVDTAISATTGVAILADVPLKEVPIQVQAEPTDEFVETAQERVTEFLASCAQQQVLQPTGCPFGLVEQNRIIDLPTWSITEQPTVAIQPDGANWRIPDTTAMAHIEVSVQSLFDGSISTLSQDIPFIVNGSITTLGDGSVSIRVGGTPAD